CERLAGGCGYCARRHDHDTTAGRLAGRSCEAGQDPVDACCRSRRLRTRDDPCRPDGRAGQGGVQCGVSLVQRDESPLPADRGTPLRKDAGMERFTNDGFTFDVTDTPGTGDGQVAVLLHGFPEDRHCWDAVTMALAGAGYRVLAPDLRGYSA